MTGGRKIITNTLLLSVVSIVNTFVSIFTTSIIAKSIGPELYGRYTFGLSYILFFSVLSNLGIESLFIREAARDEKNIDLIKDILPFKVLLSALNIAVIILSVHLLHYPVETIQVIYVLCIGLFFQVLYESLLSVYRSLEKMYVIGLASLAFRLFTALIIVFAVYSGIGFWGIVSAFSIGNAFIFLGLLLFSYRSLGISGVRFKAQTWLRLIKQGFPFYASALLTMVYSRIGILMLSKMTSELEVGLYMAAVTLVEGLYFIPAAFTSSIFPAFSRMHGGSGDTFQSTYEKTTKFLIILTAGISVGTILVSEKVIFLIFGPEFIRSAEVLNIFIFFWVFSFFSQMQSTILFSIRKEAAQVKIMAFACLVNISLNIILIKNYGIIGAAYSSVITEAVVVVVINAVLWKLDVKYRPDPHIFRLVFSVAAMIVMVNFLLDINLFAAILGGAAFYPVLLFLFGVFDSEDKLYIRSLIKKRAPI
ncbi:MAG: oligosaccharide flippase family protein [Candidatus Manganitrophus sp. SB1]|nr:oligosaccharide flippase family protein [Candidatus Manganitrophus morganii]